MPSLTSRSRPHRAVSCSSLIPVFLGILGVLLAVCALGPPQAHARGEVYVPPELQPWVPWVLEDHPRLRCPVVDGEAVCLWPGGLVLDAGGGGADFSLLVELDREMPVPLPGGDGIWPQRVEVDGERRPVLDAEGIPMVRMGSGSHEIRGSFLWEEMPRGVRVPPLTGTVRLQVNGTPVAWPRIDDEGTLRLGAGDTRPAEENRLDLEVSRLVHDGVPLRVDTRIEVRAAGASREVDLGQVGVPGLIPVSLEADLPARLDEDRHLVIQVRPGAFAVSFSALAEGPVTELSAPAPSPPWPEREFWAVETDDRVRAVKLSGPPAVDPGRTPLPEDWRGLPTFLVSPDQPLVMEVLRRGEPEPAPNRLELRRELWLDADGGGLTVRDRFTGTLNRGWRLDMLPPGDLGHVQVDGQDQVVTRDEGDGAGVELRNASLDLVADSRYEGRPAVLPAVGWSTDVHRLSATLHLPPGWKLLAGTGVDDLTGSVLARWSLFDLFFVLVVSLAVGRLLGWPWLLVSLAGLALSRHQPGAPEWLWAVLLVLVALGRAVRGDRVQLGTRLLRWFFSLVLLVVLVPFALEQVRVGMYPVLEHPYTTGAQPPTEAISTDGLTDMVGLDRGIADAEPQVKQPARPQGSKDGRGSGLEVAGNLLRSSTVAQEVKVEVSKGEWGASRYLSLQYDPSSVYNTGPGVQGWTWNEQSLEWSGPVTEEHTFRLMLIGPRLELLLRLVRVTLLLLLALRLLGARRLWRMRAEMGGGRAATAMALLGTLGLGLAPASAQAAPDSDLLRDLENRLTRPEPCAPHCVTVPDAWMGVRRDRLTVVAEVHAEARSAWPVPGPAGAWVPERVRVDDEETTALARLEDGFLHVRVEPGVHTVRVSGPLPATDALSLRLGLVPERLIFDARDWTLEGLHADGTVERTVQLTRVLGGAEGAREGQRTSSDNLAPWVEVRRFLDLGIPWRVRTEVERMGPADSPLTLQVPVLPGEAVTDERLQVQEGAVLVSLDPDRPRVTWVSTLEITDPLVLEAPQGVPWTEQWTVSCSPVYACDFSGPPPLRHVVEGAWSPQWRAWPGERVEIAVERPEPVPGQTVTVDQAWMEITPGHRLSEGTLHLSIRTSQGGQQEVTLPEGARLLEVVIDGEPRPIQAREHRVPVPLQPGSQLVRIAWQQPHDPTLFDRVPEVHLGSEAVNATVVVHAPDERWILFLDGPRWGPVVLLWTFVFMVVVAAPLLARLPWAPLRTRHWLLLGLGMTQVPVPTFAVVVLWFVALGYRRRRPFRHWLAFDAGQLVLVGLTLAAMGSLYAAIHAGLLFQPDMQIMGNGSSGSQLQWFQDRVDGTLPTPTIVSLPMWVWRVTMLLWSLWLAASLIRWLPWAWQAFTEGGTFRAPPPSPSRDGGPGGRGALASADEPTAEARHGQAPSTSAERAPVSTAAPRAARPEAHTPGASRPGASRPGEIGSGEFGPAGFGEEKTEISAGPPPLVHEDETPVPPSSHDAPEPGALSDDPAASFDEVPVEEAGSGGEPGAHEQADDDRLADFTEPRGFPWEDPDRLPPDLVEPAEDNEPGEE